MHIKLISLDLFFLKPPVGHNVRVPLYGENTIEQCVVRGNRCAGCECNRVLRVLAMAFNEGGNFIYQRLRPQTETILPFFLFLKLADPLLTL